MKTSKERLTALEAQVQELQNMVCVLINPKTRDSCKCPDVERVDPWQHEKNHDDMISFYVRYNAVNYSKLVPLDEKKHITVGDYYKDLELAVKRYREARRDIVPEVQA